MLETIQTGRVEAIGQLLPCLVHIGKILAGMLHVHSLRDARVEVFGGFGEFRGSSYDLGASAGLAEIRFNVRLKMLSRFRQRSRQSLDLLHVYWNRNSQRSVEQRIKLSDP